MIFSNRKKEKALTLSGLSPTVSCGGRSQPCPAPEEAAKLSAVFACISIISNSMSKLPCRIMDLDTRQTVKDSELNWLLSVRPNPAMGPAQEKKILYENLLTRGNAYEWIIRKGGKPRELIPVPAELVSPWRDRNGRMWYDVSHPYTGETKRVPGSDMVHLMQHTHDGIKGISPLELASEVISTGLASQRYENDYYSNGGQPSGVLQTDSDLGGSVTVTSDGVTSTISKKEALRREWEKIHSGSGNSHRIAILDYGLKYNPINISQSDAQFIESKAVNVEDIARFFGVPLYKLQAGKQSYSSNEQNAIEYVTSTLHPLCVALEEERSYKLLTTPELEAGLWIRVNMMAELRGDFGSRGNWYRTMREIGYFSVNDIARLEDTPDVPGGETRYSSLNYVPLEDFRELSRNRNSETKGENSNA